MFEKNLGKKIKKFFLMVMIAFCLSACTSFKEIRKKDYPKTTSSVAVISLLEYGLEGQGIDFGFFKDKKYKFSSNGVNFFDANHYAENLLKNSIMEKKLLLIDLKYSTLMLKENQHISLLQIVREIELNNKKLPDYYLVAIPRSTTDSYVKPDDKFNEFNPSPYLFGAAVLSAFVNPIPTIVFSSIAIDHQYKKYSDLKLSDKPIYQKGESLNGKNFKIESVKNGKSSCNVAFELFLIDQKQKIIIAFASKRFSGELQKHYDWEKFGYFSNFNSEEKKEIQSGCLQVFEKGLKTSIEVIGIGKDAK
jgi:hypothetical protein